MEISEPAVASVEIIESYSWLIWKSTRLTFSSLEKEAIVGRDSFKRSFCVFDDDVESIGSIEVNDDNVLSNFKFKKIIQ